MIVADLAHLPISMNKEILGGTPVFKGTRVPIKTVFDYLADGCNLEEFLENFPTVSRTNAIAVLEAGASNLVDIALQS